MKIKERALSLLLSLVMVLTFMPALAFAGTEGPTEEDYTWDLYFPEDLPFEADGETAIFYRDDYGIAHVFALYSAWSDEVTGFNYQWLKGTGEPVDDNWIFKSKEDDDYFEIEVNETGYYTLYVKDGDGRQKSIRASVIDPPWTVEGSMSSEYYTGSPITLSVTVTPSVSGLSYEWHRYSYEQDTDELLPGNTSSIVVDEEDAYFCRISDGSYKTEYWYDVFSESAYDPCANGHTWNTAYTIDLAPTTTAPGRQSIHCAVCGVIKAGSEVSIPQLEIQDLPTVKISKPSAGKKKITVKWKKVSKKNLKKISGIQIEVATDPAFTNIVKTATAGKKKSTKVIKGLQPKTKYYVRIRAFAAGSHFSAWKSKSVKVK